MLPASTSGQIAVAAAAGLVLLYLLAPRRKPPPPPPEPPPPPPPPSVYAFPTDVHLLHCGGLAEEVAGMLQGKLSKGTADITCHVHNMSGFKKWASHMALETRDTPLHVIFIVATIENEQPAEDAGACVRYFNRRTHADDLLQGRLIYAVLGLGDSNLLLDRQTTTAKDCNQVARRLDSRLAGLGAVRFTGLGETDDRTGNTELDPWISACVETLAKPP